MATYRLHGETVTRAKGHSVVARAAYNARAKLYDERLGQWWDFARKRDLDHREILAPAHAPAWVFDRERLWNAVEASEGRRKNAQTARSFIGSIPVELSQEAGRELVRNFIREEFVARGMVADVAIHESAHNPHFHVLLTLRELEGDGFARTKQRAWNERGLFQDWRVAWQDH
ncbi:MAG TPA: MobA/MobL family protein, partial [Polyangiales bacterium]|nr:MobA/MobL family protein [Polyangiales bacterium]